MTRFAAIEARINTAAMQQLCNCTATVNGQPVQAIFDNGYALGNVGLVGMAGSQPTLTTATASLPADPVGMPATVGAASYTVVAHEPDGTGISRLLLEVAE